MKFQKQTIIALVVGALIQLGLLFTVNTSSGKWSPEPMDSASSFCNTCEGGCAVMGCNDLAFCASTDCNCACNCDGVYFTYSCEESVEGKGP